MRRAEPDYVSGERGRYEVAPPVVHPPRCVCAICPNHRAKAIAKVRAAWVHEGRDFTEADLRLEVWSRPLTIRQRRPAPKDARTSRPAAAAYARQFKREEEARLVAAVEKAEREKRAQATAVRFGAVCDAYRRHQQEEGKRYDRDRYRIDAAEKFFGGARDAMSLDRDAYVAFKTHLAGTGVVAATILRYTTVLVAMMNHAVREGLIPAHHLTNLQRPKTKKRKKPVTFTRRQVEVLLGTAMNTYEREQASDAQAWQREQQRRVAERRPALSKKGPSSVPLRGFCLIAYMTLMRPANNFGLRWDQLQIERQGDAGRFHLDEHKNSSKGVTVEGGLHPTLVRYLRAICPGRAATGVVHPNPATGKPYVHIRRQWERLVEIANGMLPSDEQLTGKRAEFYTWRHTGASELAAKGADPVMIVRMMGDTSLKTVMDHYFDSSVEHMQEVLARWEPAGGEVRDERGEETGWTN